ncbi:MAG: hypothetical protein SFT94_02170 [Pseudanabaenaceae cyanobacterium bins.68]|nr:hypothetical protein [Pseudanabaenaceae cyanobacterium bins.68]
MSLADLKAALEAATGLEVTEEKLRDRLDLLAIAATLQSGINSAATPRTFNYREIPGNVNTLIFAGARHISVANRSCADGLTITPGDGTVLVGESLATPDLGNGVLPEIRILPITQNASHRYLILEVR